MKSITAEFGIAKASISKWCKEFSKECQIKSPNDQTAVNEADLMKENLRLRRELEEARKENLFKKSGGILCKGNRLEAYRFIEQHHGEFGIRWLLRKLSVYPNVYYNFLKHRKTDYYVLSSKLNAASSVTLKQVFYSA